MEQASQKIFCDPDILQSKSYRITHEVFSAITHGIGFVLSFIGTILMIGKGIQDLNLFNTIVYLVYGLSMCTLFFTSMMYHSLSFTKVGPLFQFFDHATIYLYIAGSYTPFCLIAIGGWFGWTICILVWLIAILGISAKIANAPWMRKYSTTFYLAMGWLAVFMIVPLYYSVPIEGLLWLIAGGLFYTIGTYFFRYDLKYAYYHVIWHIFVLLGSVGIYFAIFLYI